jgi:hypothetical protein
MKIGNWTRKIAAALVAGGLLAPFSVVAAPLNTNLLVDPGFEDVDAGTVGAYGSLLLNSWTDGSTTSNYTYASGQYDLGGPLAGGGDRYFTSNGGEDKLGPGQAAQDVDLSTGDSAAAIGAGLGTFDLSAYMTSYAGNDVAHIHVDFLDGSGGSLSTTDLADGDNTTWTFNSVSGSIPVGTAMARVSLYGVAGSGGPDGYLDNVSFSVGRVPEPTSLILVGLGMGAAGTVLGRRRR